MKSTHHYLAIDLLRILAATLVLLNHFATFGGASASVVDLDQAAFGFLSAFAGVGAVGVEIFFVISGFVIAMSASGKGGLSHAFRFARLRAVRILPALWISALICLAARAAYGENVSSLPMAFIRSIILSPKGPYIDGVVWSLVVEAVFYATIFICIISRFRLSLYGLAIVIGACSSVYVLALFVLNSMPANSFSPDVIAPLSGFHFKVLLLQHGIFFAAGMMLFGLNDSLQRLRRTQMASLMYVFLAMGVLEVLFSVDRAYSYRIAAAGIWASCVAAIILNVVSQDAVNSRLLGYSRAIKFCGRLSYPLYLNHYASGMIIVWFVNSFRLPAPVSFGVSLLTVLILSLAVLWLEGKIQGVAKSWFHTPASASQVKPADDDTRVRVVAAGA
ncbi:MULTISPECIES: acyltransferase [unclassified Mesorhizobium]|uniref:acyltransferase family protein n=1 Tax=unclassified Mesorhizobium TaxID=325217 RepID=UPI00112DC1F3|nr:MULTISPECIES: acyltransferase [unclassified Mesorhizobium]TPN50172.1 acyltransferase [Mesorhizobium sp. B1-1-9]TPN53278.1 acyltransferase [Mesorhizobium sp. B1-1-7]